MSVSDVPVPASSSSSSASASASSASSSGERARSHLTLWTVNGGRVRQIETTERVTCVVLSTAMEGVNSNIVAGGLESGGIHIWSLWDLSHVRKLAEVTAPVLSLVTALDNSCLLASNRLGEVVGFGRKQDREKKRILPPANVSSSTSAFNVAFNPVGGIVFFFFFFAFLCCFCV